MVSKDEKNDFSLMIEKRCQEKQTTLLETIIDYCEESGLEPEVAGTLLNFTLKQRTRG